MSHERNDPYFSELVFESTERELPIPPRESSAAAVPKPAPAKRTAGTPEVQQLALWAEERREPVKTTEGEFVQRAKEMAEYKEAPALFVPFKSYWPTYGHMTGAQSRWYFYWRGEVREGRYPKTDLSYIFLHVYELINGVGWNEPREGLRQLEGLWEAYRDSYKRLDQYMSAWIADFSFVHKLNISLSRIVARTRGLAGDLAEMELMRCLTTAPEELTFDALTIMSDYDISKSKFYAGEGKMLAERYIPRVIALINAYVARKHGQSLIEMFPPGPAVPRERYLFRSAVYDISLYGYSVLVPVARISKSAPLRSLFTRLFRLTENKLRELTGYRGRLKGIKIEAEMEDAVSRYLEREFRREQQEAKGPAVVIDPEKLTRLENDSNIVRGLLTVEDSQSPSEEADGKAGQSEEATHDMPAADTPTDDIDKDIVNAVNESVPSGETGGNSGGNPEWMEFSEALQPLERKALLLLAERGIGALQPFAAEAGTMAELLINDINEIAMEHLGDLLIDGDELSEEYEPLLQYLRGESS